MIEDWKPLGKGYSKCVRCALSKNSEFYKWYSLVTKDFLGNVCEVCMIKERFGKKSNKKYITWENGRNRRKRNS
tara:strand:+ start:172 stop:393 length:222 start_codon:yes stop_codon:yes gene_type:complete